MGCISLDLTIDGALADPVIGAAMRADHVDPRRLEDLLRATARSLDTSRQPVSTLCAAVARGLHGAINGARPRW